MAPRISVTTELEQSIQARLRALLDQAFAGDFTEDDWHHALGGHHALVFDGEDVLVSHAGVVPRTLWANGQRLRTGYVEAVATMPRKQRRGFGTLVMRALNPVLATYDLGALCTGTHSFYERLGWERWRGATWVETATGRIRTPEEDDTIMLWRQSATAGLDLEGDLVCEERSGDDW